MKFLLRSILLLSLLGSLNTKANAQKDFIVTSKNDTIFGEIKSTLFGGYRFKPKGGNKFSKIDPLVTKEYFIVEKSINYLSKLKPDATEPIFLKRLENGKIQLFEYYRQGYQNTYEQRWYAAKGTDPLVEIKTNQIFGSRKERKENFYSLIGDNGSLLSEFKIHDRFGFNDVRDCIKSYNK